jgi:hypothetical protein
LRERHGRLAGRGFVARGGCAWALRGGLTAADHVECMPVVVLVPAARSRVFLVASLSLRERTPALTKRVSVTFVGLPPRCRGGTESLEIIYIDAANVYSIVDIFGRYVWREKGAKGGTIEGSMLRHSVDRRIGTGGGRLLIRKKHGRFHVIFTWRATTIRQMPSVALSLSVAFWR